MKHAPPSFDLEGAGALVLGGGGGIGGAVVSRLAAAGARVVSADRAHTIDDPSHIHCDLADPTDAERAVAGAVERLGQLDVVVHCAGITRDGVHWKLSDEDWRAVMAVNLDSAFHLLRAAAPHLRRSQRAAVVLVSSINGERGKFGQSNYSASKAGLIALAKSAARELGAHGVRVNAVAPGMIDTELTRALPEAVREQAVRETALGRAGAPEDVADAVLFLVSALARHVTGQVLRVDGGQLMA